MSEEENVMPAGLRRTVLSHLRLRTHDVAATVDFYERVVGLVRHAPADGAEALLGWGQGHHVLELVTGAPGLEAFAYEVRDPGGVEALGSRLADAGITVQSAAGAAGGIAVIDPEGRRVEFHGPVSRTGELTADPGRRPLRVQHVTLASPDLDRLAGFYASLGLSVTDRMGDVFTWLRSDVAHHSLAVVKAPEAAMDHYSFDVNGWDDFKTWCDRLADLDVPVTWGPGRHGPGNNLFIMFDDVDGNRVELSAEMERFWDDRVSYVVRRWKPEPRTINLWGGQLAAWRTTRP